jgi:hypothetical protein
LRAFLEKLGNIEGEGLDRLIDLHIVPPGDGRPNAVVVFLQPSQQPHPGLRVGATPVLAHALFLQILQGVLPMIVKEGENLLQMSVVNRSDIFSQLLQSELRLGVAM